jgi:hypothetical protein
MSLDSKISSDLCQYENKFIFDEIEVNGENKAPFEANANYTMTSINKIREMA